MKRFNWNAFWASVPGIIFLSMTVVFVPMLAWLWWFERQQTNRLIVALAVTGAYLAWTSWNCIGAYRDEVKQQRKATSRVVLKGAVRMPNGETLRPVPYAARFGYDAPR